MPEETIEQEARRFEPKVIPERKQQQPIADYSQAPSEPKNYRLSNWYKEYLGTEQRQRNLARNPISEKAQMLGAIRFGGEFTPATGQIPQQPLTGEFIPEEPWDYQTAKLNQQGEELPSGAVAWTPSGEPWYGAGLGGTWNKIKSIFSESIAVHTLGTEEYEAQQKNFKEADGLWQKAKAITKNLLVVDAGRIVFNAAILPLNFFEELVGRPYTTASMVMEDMAQDSTWKPMTTKVSDWLPGKTETYVQRANPIRNVYNMARVIESMFTSEKDWTMDEKIELWRSNAAASIMGWSIGAGEQQYKAEFFARVSEGEHPDLVALDMERPGSELLGAITFDLSGFLSIAMKGLKATDDLADISKTLLRGADEVAEVLAKHGDEGISILKGTSNLDELAEATAKATKRYADEVTSEANKFGMGELTGNAKRQKAATESGIFGQWIAGVVKDPDEATAVFQNMARLVSDDVLEQKKAIAFLAEALGPNAEAAFSEGGLKFGLLMKGMLSDPDGVIDMTRFADEFLELQKTGDVQKIWGFLGGKLDDVIAKTFPLADEVIEAGAKVPFITRMLSKADTGFAGKVKEKINWFAGRAYIGINPGVAARGGLYDLFQSVVDTDISILTKSPSKWADISVKWLGAEHISLTKGFAKAEIAGLEELIKAETGYKNLPTFLEALRGGEDVSKLDKVSLPFARILQRLEISSSQRIIGKATDDAMKKILRTDGAFASIDELVAAGLPKAAADNLIERIIGNYGDTKLVKAELLKQVKEGSLELFSSGAWLDDGARKIFDEFGVTDDFLNALKEGNTVEQSLEMLWKTKDDLMIQAENLTKQHAQAVVDGLNDPYGLAQINKGLYEAVEGGAPLQDVLDLANDTIQIDRSTTRSWINAGEDIVNQLISHFEGTGDRVASDALRNMRANGLFDGVGNTFADVTKANQRTMDDVPLWVEKIRKSRGANRTDIIKDVEKLFGIDNLPKDKSAADMLWEIMKGDRQQPLFMDARKAASSEFEDVLIALKSAVDGNIVDEIVSTSGPVERARLLERLALQFDNAIMIDGELKPVGEYLRFLMGKGKNKEAIRLLASKARLIASAKPSSKLFDTDILTTLNHFGVEGDDLAKIDPEDAFGALQEWRALRGLQRQADDLTGLIGDLPTIQVPKFMSEIHKITNTYALTESIGDPEIQMIIKFIEDNANSDLTSHLAGVSEGKLMDELIDVAKKVQDEILAGGNVKAGPATSEMLNELRKAGIAFEDNITQADAWKKLQGIADEVPSLIPPMDDGAPTTARNIWERRYDIDAAFAKASEGIKDNFGKAMPVEGEAPVLADALNKWFDVADGRVNDAKLMASKYAQGMRDFVLHDYSQRYGFDHALSYMNNFHFWPSRTATKWLSTRIWRNPKLISDYMDYREYMQNLHKDSPEWWRYAINANELLEPLGLHMENPLHFRLENLIQPIYFMGTGDFVDPKKRVNWWSSMMDDIGRYSPGYFNPVIQYAVATALAAKEEDEASARWAGRLLPATGLIQSITSIIGINEGKGVEVDPSVHIFSGGMGPYETNRVAKVLAGFVKEGKYSEAEIIDAAFTHSGLIWDEAVATQRQQFGVGNIISTFSGINTRQRTGADLAADSFWSDYIMVMSRSADMPPEELRYNMEKLREVHPMMDALLLGRKGEQERDSAYTWSVLSRIKPGNTDDLAKSMGLPYDMISKFYDDKGDFSNWSEPDKDRFMSAVVSLGASLDLPELSTRKEWAAASVEYGKMMDVGKKLFGEDIWDRLDMSYTMRDEGINSNAEFQSYLDRNPDVEMTMRWRDMYVLQNHLLSAYYGGQEKLRDYYKGVMYQEIENELGKNIWKTWSFYWALQNTGQGEEAAAYKKQHPELKKYSEIKKEKMAEIQELMVEYGEQLPEGQDIRLRVTEEVGSFGEQQIRDFLNQPQTRAYTKSEWVEIIGAEETQMAILIWEDVDIPQDIISHLRGIADSLDMTYDELITSIGQAD